ncbi:amidohydrolase family protein [soil metagenome]
MKRMLFLYSLSLVALFLSCRPGSWSGYTGKAPPAAPAPVIRGVNEGEIAEGRKTIVLVGATLLDGRGGEPVADAIVVVEGNKIMAVGKRGEIDLPAGAEVVEAAGLFLLPGLIDAHFHLDGIAKLPNDFLRNGITSLRDPGEWIEYYEAERAAGYPLPRLFLTGPHLDMPPAAHPKHSVLIRDPDEAVRQVHKLADQGASAIKIYYRLSLGVMAAICEAAHARGLPVTAHLEISDVREVIKAGVDGIEHVTSLGLSLLPGPEAKQYRQAVLADNNARKNGRYAVWNTLNLNSKKVDSLLFLFKDRQTFLCPTLAAFEYRLGAGKEDTVQANGFRNMLALVGKAHRAGVRVVVGSHSMVPYAEKGWAFHQEMELLAESGMPPAAIIIAATLENARFFRVENRLGSIERGKVADLVLVRENPLADIRALRQVERVMLNGVWLTGEEGIVWRRLLLL